MPFRQQEPSRARRMRCAVQGRASDAAYTVSGAATTAAGAAKGAALTAAGATQEAAQVVAGRANDAARVAAQEAAGRTSQAATVVTERARPMAAEAAQRTGAAWRILLHGVPRRGPMSRVASVLPLGTATTAARRGKAPMMMAIGVAGMVGALLWRRSRTDRDTVWILDEDSDIEPVGRWPEGDSHLATHDAVPGAVDDTVHDDLDEGAARTGRTDRDTRYAKNSDQNGDRKDSPANRWP
jgi:hypothetical protein